MRGTRRSRGHSVAKYCRSTGEVVAESGVRGALSPSPIRLSADDYRFYLFAAIARQAFRRAAHLRKSGLSIGSRGRIATYRPVSALRCSF